MIKLRSQIVQCVIGLTFGWSALADEGGNARVPAAPDPTAHQIYEEAQKGNLAKAQQMIEVVIRHHPASAKAHFIQAELFYRERKFDMARDQLATAESLSPGLPAVDPQAVAKLKRNLERSK